MVAHGAEFHICMRYIEVFIRTFKRVMITSKDFSVHCRVSIKISGLDFLLQDWNHVKFAHLKSIAMTLR